MERELPNWLVIEAYGCLFSYNLNSVFLVRLVVLEDVTAIVCGSLDGDTEEMYIDLAFLKLS